MPNTSKLLYKGHRIEEVLPEDSWRDRVAEAGLTLLSPKEWYWRDHTELEPRCDHFEAESLFSNYKKSLKLLHPIQSRLLNLL